MTYKLSHLSILGAIAALSASQLYAATLGLTATDAGFVTEMGGSAKGDGTVVAGATYNYSVGWELHYADGALGPSFAPMDRKNYFVFDLTGISEMITSATLTLWTGTLESVDGMEMYEMFEITDPPGALGLATALGTGTTTGEFDDPTDPLVMAAKMLYTKIGDGPLLLGGAMVTSADDDTFIDIPISPGGIGYLNTIKGGKIVLGGEVTSVVGVDTPQQPFGFTGPDIPGEDVMTPVLTITTAPVPEPSAAMLLTTVGAVAVRRFRRK